MESDHQVSESTDSRPGIGWMKGIGWTILVLVLLVALALVWNQHTATSKLQETLARMDREEPGWRWEAIEAAREEIPEEKNSADGIIAAARLLPEKWTTPPFTPEDFLRLPPVELLSVEDFARLREELARARPALNITAKLADMPRGRYPIQLARNPIETLLPYPQKSRKIVTLLVCESMRQNQNGDSTKALRACRAALNAARSVGDEPFYIVQFVRTAGVILALQAIERTLGQGEPAPDDMTRLQKLLEDEDAYAGLLVGSRGELAMMHRLFEAVERGEISVDELLRMSGERKKSSWLESTAISLWRMDTHEDHDLYLSWMTRRLKEVQQPLHEQAELEKRFEWETRTLPKSAVISRLLLPAVVRLGQAHRSKHAYVRCTLLALAAERFRRDKKTWPENVDQLLPHYLANVLLDPFDGKPLRYRRIEDGVVIYSIGQDTIDNGGNLDPEHQQYSDVDLGVRLWDAAKRRQPSKQKPGRQQEAGDP